jgi:hypothetical protein
MRESNVALALGRATKLGEHGSLPNNPAKHKGMKIPIQSLEVEGCNAGHPFKNITPLARRAGISHPTLVTQEIWDAYIKNAGDLFILGDVVLVLRCVLTGHYPHRIAGEARHFEMYAYRQGRVEPELIKLTAVEQIQNDHSKYLVLMLENGWREA